MKRPSRKTPRSTSRKGEGPSKGALPPISNRRRWLFRFLALLLPILFLITVETALRLGGYGYSPDFFKKIRIQNEVFYVQNDDVALRFFPPETARNPGPIRMRADKPRNTFRIFIFGESAAMGDPEPAYGAGRYMEILLRERFPEAKFEIINTAFTAINSHVILPISRECADKQGDLWIIYMGNNEMVGPYGAATVFGAKAPPLLFVKITVAAQRFRIGQLLMSLARKLGTRSGANESWGGMQMFLRNQISPNDARKIPVYHHFQKNLQEILQAGRTSGAKILLSTVAVNLKNCPPFASLANTNVTATEQNDLKQLFAEGKHFQDANDCTNAARLFSEAITRDPLFAETQFRLGQCQLQLGQLTNARVHFQAACDSDALPFRADTKINEIIRDAAKTFGTGNLTLLDADEALRTNGGDPIAGEESFFEHVHFNFDGNYRLGLSWAEAVSQALPHSLTNRAVAHWASHAECDKHLGLTDWNRSFVLEAVIRRLQQPPLSSQFDNNARLQSFREQLQLYRNRMTPAATPQIPGDFTAEIQKHPEDYSLREGFADFLEATGAYHEAGLQWSEVERLIPQDFLAAYQAGRMLARQNNFGQAAESLQRAVELRPRFAEAWLELGRVQASEGKFQSALGSFTRAMTLRPQDPIAIGYKAKVLSRLNRTEEAFDLFRRSIELNPDYWEGHNAFADALADRGRSDEAAREYEIVTRLNPAYPMAHLNLGVMLVKLGRNSEGIRQFEETLRLDPGNAPARQYLDRIQGAKAK